MKKIAALLSCVMLATACQAQEPATTATISAPVNVYFELYKGCVAGTLKNGHYPEQRKDIAPFLEALDENCFAWAELWFPVVNNVGRKRLTDDEFGRAYKRRESLIEDLAKQLVEMTKK